MSSLYLSQYEKEALKALDIRKLEQLLDQALSIGRATALHDLHLSQCGAYVAERLRRFERDLADHAISKAAKKWAETSKRAWSTGQDLLRAVRDTTGRMDEEEQETQLFRINDMISSPFRFSQHLEVRVHYEWRPTINDEWRLGTITFTHRVDIRADYVGTQPKRKASAAKVERELQETLYRHWDHFRMLAVHAVAQISEIRRRRGHDSPVVRGETRAS